MISIPEILKDNTELLDLFSRKEEYFPKKLDAHGRFNYTLSSNNNIFEPKVSKFLLDKGLKIEYPENKKFGVCLTHDIDEIYPVQSHMLLSSLYDLKNRNLKKLFNQLLWRKKGKEFSPYRNFKDIIKLEEKYNSKSSFYFLAADSDIKRFRYDIEDVENDLGFIIDKGWEVGLHCGYYSYDNLTEINKEKKRLEKLIGKEVIGGRNHYLRFKVPDTWEVLAKAEFKYDSTFGYSDVVGFRNGMCHPFKPINLNTHTEVDILEIPLNIMDSTLFEYMGSVDAWETVKKLINSTEKYNGVITLLWHNDVLNCSFREKWKKLYEKILLYCFEKNAWMTSGEEVYRWWQKNGY